MPPGPLLVVDQVAGYAEELLQAPPHGQRRRLVEKLALLQPGEASPDVDLQARGRRGDPAALRARLGVLVEERRAVDLARSQVVDEEASVDHQRRVCREELCDA